MMDERERLRKIVMEEQEGRCAICEQRETKLKNGDVLTIDRDPVTGVVRGLLCSKCNMALGLFQDNAELLDRASLYLSA